jgi:uncharacterized membrane protein (DUF485 family)
MSATARRRRSTVHRTASRPYRVTFFSVGYVTHISTTFPPEPVHSSQEREIKVSETDLPIHPEAISGERYLEVQASPEFQELRNRLRRFVFPMTAFFLIWYTTYVILGAFAHDFMATKVWGEINVGLIIGLGQFLSTFVITALYVRFANRELDDRAGAIRTQLESELT